MRKNNLNNGRVLIVSLLASLVLAACGGGGGGGASTPISDPILQAGLIAPKNMGGTAIVGQEYKGLVEVIPYDSSATVESLSITNNTAGGSVPSIDLAGNITWVPNEQDFAGTASLRVTGKLSSGAVIADNVPLDVRKVRVVMQRTLGATEQVYSDTDNLYSISITKKTVNSIISGELAVKETYRKNGEFSWFFEAKGDGFNATVLQAPTTQISPLSSTANTTKTQIGIVQQAYPISQLNVGTGAFSDIKEEGSVVGHQLIVGSDVGGNNVYTSRPAGNATFYVENLSDSRSTSLDGFPVFWFGSNCSDSSILTGAGSLSTPVTAGASCEFRAISKSPVILIHGFSGTDNVGYESIEGGGVGTWGQTANLLTEQGHPVFEMRWMSYMPFEDAAGALAKFGKDIAKITGKKPIILAHSFGGVVSHLALQNKGREWKSSEYGVGHWESVNSDGVFAKLITLDSPLSGINADGGAGFNAFKKIYDAAGNLQDVAFPRGVDRTDGLIKMCYAITCAQAGASFNNSAGFKSLAINKSLIDGYNPTLYLPPSKISIRDAEIIGGVSRSLKEGEAIADMQTGISQAKENAPYLTVVGFRPFIYESDRVVSFYDFGDGLISIMGQAAIPQDFSDNAFDAKSNASFKFKFENDTYPATLGGTAKFATLEKGNCLQYDVSSRNYLICGNAAHTSSMIKTPGDFGIRSIVRTPGGGSVDSYAVAAYDGEPLKHVIPRLVYGDKYMSISTQDSPFANQTSLTSVISGHLGASVAAKQVGVVSAASLSPIKSAVIWATIIEKSTGISRHYFNGARSDDSGNFTVDVGSVVSSKFGANAVLPNYSVKLKIDVVGYQSWTKTIDSLGAVINLGDIDLSLASSSADFATVLASGFYSGDCLFDRTGNCAANTAYFKTIGSATTWVQSRYNGFDIGTADANWMVSSGVGGNFVLSPSSGWVAMSNSGTWVPEGLGGISTDSATGEQLRHTLRVLDVANKSFGSVAGVSVPTAIASSAFPAGAKVYYFSSTPIGERYRLYFDFQPFGRVGLLTVNFQSLAALINAKQTPAADAVGKVEVDGSNGLNFTFNEDAATALSATGGTIRLYSCSLGVSAAISNGCSGGNWVAGGSSSYTIRTVNGQQVLRINADYGSAGSKLIYGVKGDRVYGGEYSSSSGSSTLGVSFNKIAFDAVLTAAGHPLSLN